MQYPKNSTTTIQINNFLELPGIHLTNILLFLSINEILKLAEVSRSVYMNIKTRAIANPDFLLNLIRRELKDFFGSKIEFSKLYINKKNFKPNEHELYKILQALIVLERGLSKYYTSALLALNQNIKYFEAKFLFVQLFQIHADTMLLEICHNNLLSLTHFFFTRHNDTLNTIVLAHYYGLVHAWIEKVKSNPTPMGLARIKIFYDYFEKQARNDSSLRSTLSDDFSKAIYPELRVIKGIIRKFKKTNLTLEAKETLVPLYLQIMIKRYMQSAINKINPSFENIILQRPKDVHNLLILLMLHSKNAHLVLQLINQYSLAESFFSLSEKQMSFIFKSDFRWLFATYKQTTLQEIVSFMQYHISETHLNFIDKRLKKYVELQIYTPNLEELWQMQSIFALSDKVGLSDVFMSLQANIKCKWRIFHELKDNIEKQQLFRSLSEIITAECRLELSRRLTLEKAQKLNELLKNFSIFKNIPTLIAISGLILDTTYDDLAKITSILRGYQLSRFPVTLFKYVFMLHCTYKIQDELIHKILHKINFQNIDLDHYVLKVAIPNNAKKPWFDLLTFQQMLTLSQTVIETIVVIPSDTQALLIKNLLTKYENKPFNPGLMEVLDIQDAVDSTNTMSYQSSRSCSSESQSDILQKKAEIIGENAIFYAMDLSKSQKSSSCSHLTQFYTDGSKELPKKNNNTSFDTIDNEQLNQRLKS